MFGETPCVISRMVRPPLPAKVPTPCARNGVPRGRHMISQMTPASHLESRATCEPQAWQRDTKWSNLEAAHVQDLAGSHGEQVPRRLGVDVFTFRRLRVSSIFGGFCLFLGGFASLLDNSIGAYDICVAVTENLRNISRSARAK